MTDVERKQTAEPVLTIIVPTYNRAESLSVLLHALKVECCPLAGAVVVLVSDNASTDRTEDVTREMRANWPELLVQRHALNCGPEENFCTGIDRVETRYFWIIGDDDCPKVGVVAKLVALLQRELPALVYVQSEWVSRITAPTQGKPVGELSATLSRARDFARDVNTWVTFISGNIVDRTVLADALGPHTIRRFKGTSLVQLGWIFPVLLSGGRLFFVVDRCVLATAGNSGGYALLTVFGINLTRIVKEALYPGELGPIIVGRNVALYLPGLVWGARCRAFGTHLEENPWPEMRRQLGNWPLYWIFVVPIGIFPRFLARAFHLIWRLLSRVNRVAIELRYR